MTGLVRFHPLATAEVVESQLWYDDHVDGLGDRFLGALRSVVDRAARWPNAGTPTRQNASGAALERKIAVPGFPYVVVYRTAGSDLEVLAVYHERRRPFYWADARPSSSATVTRVAAASHRPRASRFRHAGSGAGAPAQSHRTGAPPRPRTVRSKQSGSCSSPDAAPSRPAHKQRTRFMP